MGFSMIKHRIVEVIENGVHYFYPQYKILFFWCYHYDIEDNKHFFPSKGAALDFIERQRNKKPDGRIIHKL